MGQQPMAQEAPQETPEVQPEPQVCERDRVRRRVGGVALGVARTPGAYVVGVGVGVCVGGGGGGGWIRLQSQPQVLRTLYNLNNLNPKPHTLDPNPHVI